MLGGLNSGGLEHLVLDVFSNNNFSIVDFSCVYRNDGNLTEKFIETSIPIIKIKPSKYNILKYYKKFRNHILSNNIDIVHAHLAIDAFYACLALRNTKVKILLTSHGYNFDGSYIFKKISRFALKNVDLNLFVSNALKNFYNKEYDLDTSKSITLYNGVSASKLKITNSVNLKKEYNLPNDSILIGMVSNFHGTGKDQITLCKAMKELKNKNIYLFLVGSYSNNNSYKDCYDYCKANDLLPNVFFTGPSNKIADVISNFDCFAFSSNHDTFGIAIVEAMLLKIPTIINDIPPFLEISNNGEFSHIYKSKNVGDFILKLDNIIENDQKIAIENAYTWAMSNFSIEKHIDNLNNIYSKFD